MGCCTSSEAADPSQPMQGGQTVGREQGRAVNRDEQRARAAAAAEARSTNNATRGQQGNHSKMRPQVSYTAAGGTGKPDLADARTWD